jgi:hypothetical protein
MADVMAMVSFAEDTLTVKNGTGLRKTLSVTRVAESSAEFSSGLPEVTSKRCPFF